MPVLPIADKVTLDAVLAYVDELESRLTAIRADYLDYLNSLNTRLTDTRAGKLDLVGTIGDVAGTNTIFARLAQIAGYTDTLESTLGQTGDAANAAGSTNAKLAYLITQTKKPKTFQASVFYNASAVQNTWYTVGSVAGAGIFNRFGASDFNGANFIEFRITIDGTAYTIPAATANLAFQMASNVWNSLPFVEFKTSLLVEVRNTGSAALLEAVAEVGLY